MTPPVGGACTGLGVHHSGSTHVSHPCATGSDSCSLLPDGPPVGRICYWANSLYSPARWLRLTTGCGGALACRRSSGPNHWRSEPRIGPRGCCRAASLITALTRSSARTCSRSRAGRLPRPRWLARGPKSSETMTIPPTDAEEFVATTRKSFGKARKRSDVASLAAAAAKCGFAITTHPATGRARSRTDARPQAARVQPRMVP